MTYTNIDIEKQMHEPYELMDKLPWDHINVKYGTSTWPRNSRVR